MFGLSGLSLLFFRPAIPKIFRHVKSHHDARQPPPAVVAENLIACLRDSWFRVVIPAVAVLWLQWQLTAAVVDGDAGHCRCSEIVIVV